MRRHAGQHRPAWGVSLQAGEAQQQAVGVSSSVMSLTNSCNMMTQRVHRPRATHLLMVACAPSKDWKASMSMKGFVLVQGLALADGGVHTPSKDWKASLPFSTLTR